METEWQPGMTLDDVERAVILRALRFYQNNKAQTARSLNIAPRTLDYKLEQYREADAKKKEEKEK